MSRVLKDRMMYGIIGLATAFTIGVLLWIIGFVFYNGFQLISWDFLTSNFDPETEYVNIPVTNNSQFNNLGIQFEKGFIEEKEVVLVNAIDENSQVRYATYKQSDKNYKIRKGDVFSRIGKKRINTLSIEELNEYINNIEENTISVRVTRPGDGIYPMLITTIFIVVLTLLIACPIGILAAIYLTEYAKPGKLVRLIRFSTESLAGIPSIIYGLFGMIFFVIYLKLDYSIMAGALTLSIILLPVIVRQTEESLKAVPLSYREASLGLGATKLQTIGKIVLPSALPGIAVAVILSTGRIVGESAALLLTAGTIARIPHNALTSGATLTVKAFAVANEEGDIVMACAIGTVVILLILILNSISKLLIRRGEYSGK